MAMLPVLEIPTLAGRLVRLEPLAEMHVDGLAAAAAQNRDSYLYANVPVGHEETSRYFRALSSAHAAGECLPFAQIRVSDAQIVGCTRFLNLRRWPDGGSLYAVEIGGTWLSAPAQRTGMNLEAKLLLLTHAFDTWKVKRVDIKTDARNSRARTAILGLGATFEGVLRSWQPSQATGEPHQLRDSAMYSIVGAQWAVTRRSLQDRLS